MTAPALSPVAERPYQRASRREVQAEVTAKPGEPAAQREVTAVPGTTDEALPAGGAAVSTDAQLLARVAAGDRTALEALYRRHAAWLAARLRARTASADLAEEALQDTFLAAWRSAGQFRGEGDVAAWLWGIAGRRLVSLSRRRRLPTVTLDSAGQRPDDAAGPAETALGAEEADRVRRAVARLPADQRDAITSVVYRGLSIGEVARAARVAEGTVKSRLHRARARIAKELEP